MENSYFISGHTIIKKKYKNLKTKMSEQFALFDYLVLSVWNYSILKFEDKIKFHRWLYCFSV